MTGIYKILPYGMIKIDKNIWAIFNRDYKIIYEFKVKRKISENTLHKINNGRSGYHNEKEWYRTDDKGKIILIWFYSPSHLFDNDMLNYSKSIMRLNKIKGDIIEQKYTGIEIGKIPVKCFCK